MTSVLPIPRVPSGPTLPGPATRRAGDRPAASDPALCRAAGHVDCGGPRRALVVHRDPVARRLLAERLVDLGVVTVAEVASSSDVPRVRNDGAGWDLVIVQPDVDEDGPDLAALLAGLDSDAEPTHVVVLPARVDAAVVARALTAGARAVLLPPRGGPPTVASSAPRIAGATHTLRDTTGAVRVITERERQILQLTANGLSNAETGARLGLSPLTVKNHLNRIGRRLGNGDRAHLVLLALRGGIID